MSKCRVLVLSDSLALPRERPNVCVLNDTWPGRLRKQEFLEVHQISIGGATIEDLLRQISYYKPIHPNIVILQAGIVDCAPRFLTRMELELVRRVPINALRNFILQTMNTKGVRRWRNITYTKAKQFERAVKTIKREFSGSLVLGIGILPALEEYERILPGVSKNIERFNAILSQCLDDGFLDMTHFPASGFMDDLHHINADGHVYIADGILTHIPKLKNNLVNPKSIT